MIQDPSAMQFQFTASEVRDALVDYLQKLNPGAGLPNYGEWKWEIVYGGQHHRHPLTLELKD